MQDTEAVIAVGRAAASGPSALAYALINGGIQRLITTFPVASPAAVLDDVDAATPRLRWNAVV